MKNTILIFICSFFVSLLVFSCSQDDDIFTFYWNQTGCADPWGGSSDDTEEELKASIIAFLANENVEVLEVEISFVEGLAESCEACSCLTGNKITVITPENDKDEMLNLNFTQE